MEWIHLKCCHEEIKPFKKSNVSSQVIEFDAWEDYDLINEFFGEHDKSLMCSREEYFEGDWYDKAT